MIHCKGLCDEWEYVRLNNWNVAKNYYCRFCSRALLEKHTTLALNNDRILCRCCHGLVRSKSVRYKYKPK